MKKILLAGSLLGIVSLATLGLNAQAQGDSDRTSNADTIGTFACQPGSCYTDRVEQQETDRQFKPVRQGTASRQCPWYRRWTKWHRNGCAWEAGPRMHARRGCRR